MSVQSTTHEERRWREVLKRTRLGRLAVALRRAARVRSDLRRSEDWQRFYSAFVSPGDLCFDIGANLGQRTGVFLKLGARVVAVEPDPNARLSLRLVCLGTRGLRVLRCGVAATPGKGAFFLHRKPALSSMKAARVSDSAISAGGDWYERIVVPYRTLSQLIDEFGDPEFIKIDAEGADLDILRGLSGPIRAFQFERSPRDGEQGELERTLRATGCDRFNTTKANRPRFDSKVWISLEALSARLRQEQGAVDVFARCSDAAPRMGARV